MSFKEFNPFKKPVTESEKEAVKNLHDFSKWCKYRTKAGTKWDKWTCSRSIGHRGKHIAGDEVERDDPDSLAGETESIIVAEWDDNNDNNGRYVSPGVSSDDVDEPIWKKAGFKNEEEYNRWKNSYED